jgi:cytochrome c
MNRTKRWNGLRAWVGPALVVALATGLGACGARRITKMGGDEPPKDQWSQGVWIYGQKCASCHGENAEGDEDTPALAGEEALPLEPTRDGSKRILAFYTAADVFAYASKEMPPMEPGQLAEEEYWALVAYVLKLGGHELGDEPLSAENAPSVKLR